MNDTFAGTWQLRYWYENTKHENRLDTSEYRVEFQKTDGGYAFHSLSGNGEAEGSHIEGRFGIDGRVVTGSWQEDTSPSGDWFGMTYKGAFQLLLSEDGKKMEGLRVSTSYNNGNPKVTSNRWEFIRLEA